VLKSIVWLSRQYNQKYVGFMAPFAKKVPYPCAKCYGQERWSSKVFQGEI